MIQILEDDLKYTLEHSSRSLVGKALKRFEIIDNPTSLKSNLKELIYEEYRNLRDILVAYSKGYAISKFDFKSKEA